MLYKVFVEWTMTALMDIEADDAEHAETLACGANMPDGEYCGESFVVRTVQDEHGKTVIGDE